MRSCSQVMRSTPSGHSTLHDPALAQNTMHEPRQRTLQFATLVQRTVESSPTSTPQFLVLTQS